MREPFVKSGAVIASLRIPSLVLAAALLLEPTAPAGAAPLQQQWVVASDVHFDPFADQALVTKLEAAPPERWRGIFESAGPQPFSGYGSDTNDALLESALGAMRNAVTSPPVVIVDGDFLAHDFRAKFEHATGLSDDTAYRAFVDKTEAFVAQEFEAAFPHARILPVVGNTDGYCADGQSGANTPFLARMGADWAGAVGAQDPLAFLAQFSAGGYYDVPLPVASAHAIVLNDTFWASGFRDTCSTPAGMPGGAEFSWLVQALKADAGGPVWIVAHLPPGIDVYSTLHATPGSPPITFLNDRDNASFIAALSSQAPPVVMAIAGHTHMDSFRIIGPESGDVRTPMLVVPSISPVASSNPSFEVLDVDAASAQVNDARVWVLHDLAALAKDGKREASWKREYDFDAIFGHGPLTAAHLSDIQQDMFENERVRKRYAEYYDGGSGRVAMPDSDWRAYWCANVALTAVAYGACAMPQIQRNLPPHPSPPPLPTPAPTPSPTPSPTTSPTPSPTASPSP